MYTVNVALRILRPKNNYVDTLLLCTKTMNNLLFLFPTFIRSLGSIALIDVY